MSVQIKNFQMIPILSIINWCRKNFKVVAVGLISLLIATIFVQHNQLQKKDTEINRITSNVRTYQDIVSNNQNNNRTLQLTIEELNHSNDSLLLQLKQTQKELKIKDKNLQQIQVINTQMKDTVTQIITKDVNFKEELKLKEKSSVNTTTENSTKAPEAEVHQVAYEPSRSNLSLHDQIGSIQEDLLSFLFKFCSQSL